MEMKTDLDREQIMMIVDRARHERSIAAGDVIATAARRALHTLAGWTDRLVHVPAMSRTARQ
jgi:hypothetical protein